MRLTILRAALAAGALASSLVPVAPAGAIVGGSPDIEHTNVGLVRLTTADGRNVTTSVCTAGHFLVAGASRTTTPWP